MTVLDVGCGPGFFTLDMARMVGPSGCVVACDLQAGMLERIRRKIQGTDLEKRVRLHQSGKDRIGLDLPVDFVLAFYMAHIARAADFTEAERPRMLFNKTVLLQNKSLR